MTYVAPIVEIEVLNTADVVMVSGLAVEDNGELKKTSWGDIGWA